MSLSDGELHGISGASVLGLTGALVFVLIASTWESCGAPLAVDTDPLRDMESIEASIAYKKSPAKQPQKPRSAPRVEKPQGVSHDETKKPVVEPDDKPKPQQTKTQDPKAPIPDRRDFEEESPGGPVSAPGPFNENRRGFADVSRGDPFFQGLAADFHENFEFPKILSATGSAAGCLHMLPDGTIKRVEVNPKSGDDALDDAVERAVQRVQKLRNGKPEPVPTHLLEQATTQWICFKADPQQQQRE